MAGLKELLPQSPLYGPPVPRGVALTWDQLRSTLSGELSGFVDAIKPGGDPLVLPDVIYLTYKSISSAVLDATLSPGVLAKWIAVVEARVSAEGQFPQWTVIYSNVSPPPVFWDYKCMKCRWWGPTLALPNETCKVVAGRISPAGWCGLWTPPDGYEKLTWPKELIAGNW